jgi:hypothetical protein
VHGRRRTQALPLSPDPLLLPLLLRTLLARLSFSGRVDRWREGEDAEGLFSRVDAALLKSQGGGQGPVVYAD